MHKTAFSIYNASAGSGKTYTLVKEYLKIILLSPKEDAYKNILAITFTNKAVHEMKSRIVDSLFDFTKDNPTDKSLNLMKDLSLETGLSLNEITAKAKLIIKNIIHNYAAFDISTIDKFTHKVIRSFAIDLNLPVTFDVSLDTESLLQEAVDAIVAEAGENDELTKLLVDFTMEKTDDDKSWDVSGEIFNTGKLILNENNREEVLSLQDKSIQEFVVLKNKLQELCNNIEAETSEQAKLALELIENKGIDLKSFSGGYFPKHLQGIAEGKFNPQNKTYHEFDDIKINKSAKDKEIIEGCVPELLSVLAVVYQKFQKKNLYEAFLKNITPLSLLNTVNNKLKNIQEEQNILSITEFNKLINEQIKHQPAPFIYERLGERYKHFFIDEFQDTSQMQWQNLIPLIDNALSSEDLQGNQGSLLIVGDPKQSIYRWRGGKAEQFIDLAKTENPFSNKDKQVINLESNYRSYDEVIHFNNDFFKFLSQKFENEDYKDLYENKSFQKSNSKKGGSVNISFLPKADEIETEEEITQDDLYLQKTLQTIYEIQQKGFSLSEIVILVRNNSKGVLLANYLTEQKIPVISSESLLLSTSSEVQFLLNMLRYLSDRKNKEALVQVLYYLVNNFETHLQIHDFIWQGLQFATEAELQQWLEDFGVQINFASIRRKPLYEIVEDLILAGIPPSKNNAYVQYFLDAVLEKDVKYQYSMADFLDFWEKSSHKLSVPTAEGAEAIRIMTIHKSKGLEFPVVIFPFAEESYSVNKREKMWLDAPEEEASFEKYLIDKSSKVKEYGAEASKVYDQKSQEELLDNVNVLYVALTRAEEQLYIISSWKDRNKQGNLPNNLASFFIEFIEDRVDFDQNSLKYDWGLSERVSIRHYSERKIDIIQPVTSSLVSENIKIAQREAMMWGSKQQEAIEFGNTMHEVLSFVKSKYDVDLAIIKAIENGLITENQKEVVLQMLNDIVFHSELADFFDGKGQVFNERTILKKGTKNHIPDRIVVKEKEAYLLDYKTGTHNQKYVVQILEYENALKEMGFSVQKKSLVYIGEKIEILNL
ncbi:exodeoxyribonuclease V subunit beta [Flavobacterium sp. H122]|uniref:UvrD-helicase domain-containing protein n=1 Tax=Flavobacterium sp. H122 TaxID=2529860 RepID=UPI0010AA63D4|nr:UvrD-helicase domain-containing protein [Flavobacterium sp. H122]